MTEQHGSTTDRIAELEREIAELKRAEQAESLDDPPICAMAISRKMAELSRLRNEPASEARTYPFYGYAPGNYWCNCVELDCKSQIPGFPNPGQFIGDKRAIRCEACAEKVAARKLSEVGTVPSPPSVEAGRSEREALERIVDDALADIVRNGTAIDTETANEIGSMLKPRLRYGGPPPPDTLAIPNARQAAHARFNAELGNAGKSIPEEVLARAFNTAMSVYERLRLGAPPSNPDGVRCSARNAYPDPLDCEWPRCSCDPYAQKAVAALAEHASQPDVVREALEAIRHISSQKLSNEIETDDRPRADFEGGYDEVVKTARRALAVTTIPSRTGLEEAAEWQPIETAPKDGQHILAWDSTTYLPPTTMHWFEDSNGKGWSLSVCDNEEEFYRTPTYWKAIPNIDDLVSIIAGTRAAKTTAPAADREGDRDG